MSCQGVSDIFFLEQCCKKHHLVSICAYLIFAYTSVEYIFRSNIIGSKGMGI